MTATEITAATAFIVNPALRNRAIARLASGAAIICPECKQIADAESGCYPCDDARFAAQAAAYDAQAASAFDPYEYDEEKWRNFCDSRSECYTD